MSDYDRPTPSQLKVLRAIAQYWGEHRYAPSFAIVADLTGLALNSTAHHIRSLSSRGFIAYDPRRSRTTRLTQMGKLAILDVDVTNRPIRGRL